MTKMLCLGDSIVAGFDGHVTVRDYQKIPQMIGKINGWQVNNQAIGATMIYANKSTWGWSLDSMLDRVDISQYDILLLGYGTNDWGENVETWSEVQRGLAIAHVKINAKAPNIKVYVECPTESFINGGSNNPSHALDLKNAQGFTQNQVNDLLISWANQWGYEYYDWRPNPIITPTNFKQVCGDQCLHPTAATMQLMASRLASWMSGGGNSSSNTSSDDVNRNSGRHEDTPAGDNSQPTQPTTPVQSDHPVTPITVNSFTYQEVQTQKQLFKTFNSNVRAFLACVNKLYDWMNQKFDIQHKHESEKLYFYDYFERPSRRYLLEQVVFVLQVMNRLIDVFNDNYLVDPETGAKTESVDYAINRSLLINKDMFDSYNGLWKLLKATTDQLVKIAQVYND